VGGILSWLSDLVSFTAPFRTGAPSSSSTCIVSSMKNGLPSVFSMMSRFSDRTSSPSPSIADIVSSALSLPSGSSLGCV
jgi:hypothetical protein